MLNKIYNSRQHHAGKSKIVDETILHFNPSLQFKLNNQYSMYTCIVYALYWLMLLLILDFAFHWGRWLTVVNCKKNLATVIVIKMNQFRYACICIESHIRFVMSLHVLFHYSWLTALSLKEVHITEMSSNMSQCSVQYW